MQLMLHPVGTLHNASFIPSQSRNSLYFESGSELCVLLIEIELINATL